MSELTLLGCAWCPRSPRTASFTAAADALATRKSPCPPGRGHGAAAGSPLFSNASPAASADQRGPVLLRHAGPVLERVDGASLRAGWSAGPLRTARARCLPLGARRTRARALARRAAGIPRSSSSCREGTHPRPAAPPAGRTSRARRDRPGHGSGHRRRASHWTTCGPTSCLKAGLLVGRPSTPPRPARHDRRDRAGGRPWIVGDSGGWTRAAGTRARRSAARQLAGSAAPPRIAHSRT